MKNLCLSLSLLLGMTLQAQIYQGFTSLGSTITLDITLNTNTDSVDIEISGPASGYYSVGFGGTGMNGTYIMLVNSNGTVGERKLGQWNGGSALTSSIAYSAITSSGLRTAYIERARIGASTNHYTFPASGGSIALIWAKGGTSFGNHGSINRGFGSINLINQCNIATTTLITQSICPGDSVQIFGDWVSQPGTYSDTLVTAIGCDSVLEQSVQFNAPIVNTLPSVSICQGDSIQIFGTWVTTATTLYDSLSTPAGCDSVVAQEILVNFTVSNTIPAAGLCAGDSVFYLDTWHNDTGSVVYNGVTAFGCDSIVTGRVNYLPTVDTGSIYLSLTFQSTMYVGTDLGATYYWFNCNTGAFVDTTMGADTLSPGNEFLQAPDTGYYAAIIVKPGFCSDTSGCKFYYVDVPEYETGISLRPIPATTSLQILLNQLSSNIDYEIFDLSGKIIACGTFQRGQSTFDISSYASGMYLLRLQDGRTLKFIKE